MHPFALSAELARPEAIQIYTNGTRYEGKWENDLRSLGTLTAVRPKNGASFASFFFFC
jgi:hypothetical protein